MKFEACKVFRTGTLFDCETVKTSRFNSFQTLEDFLRLNLKEFREERWVGHLVPNHALG
jgi:hypothetical protein